MAEADDLLVGEDHLDSLDDTNGNINMTETSFNLEGDGASNGLASGEGAGSAGAEDPELAAIKARVREMEEEAEKLRQLQDADKNMIMGSPPGVTGPLTLSLEEKIEVDNRSVYVGNVDYGATAEELEQHFHGCGSINRVTILCNKFDGHPKGFAYIEFGDKDCIHTAMAMDESLFRGRQIKVMPKRTNKPGVTTTNRFPRGMRARGRGSRGYYGGFRGMRRPRRGVYYSPY